MKTNYHSHTKWCRHGSGEIEDFITEAINKGLEEYAVTEHVPYPGLYDYRIYLEELDDFMSELNSIILKYKHKIKILKGLECEYFPEFHNFYLDLKVKYDIDFLVLGQHYEDISLSKDFFNNHTEEDIKKYEKALITGMKSGLFAFVAHPDVYLNNYPFNEAAKNCATQIFETAQKLNIPLEINANGIRYNRGYPNTDFWNQSKNYNLTYLINSDCHHPYEVYDSAIDKTYELTKQLNINVTENLIF